MTCHDDKLTLQKVTEISNNRKKKKKDKKQSFPKSKV